MNIIAFVGAGIIGAVLCAVLRQYKPEFGIYISLAAGMLILGTAIVAIRPVIETLTELAGYSGVDNGYAEILIKSLAVCFLTQLAAESCRDAGEGAIASKIEFAGKCAIVLTALPLFTSLAQLVTDMMP
ncbi:MAG: stage III sporulation protein AC/AD protein family [Eubacterium sp.]|nr:stage III sporulation protein AC/AD protein family [Eubacterium sp.]